MKTIKGFEGLLAIYKQLPKVGGFFVNKEFSNERSVIKNSDYYLAESEEEDEDIADDNDEIKESFVNELSNAVSPILGSRNFSAFYGYFYG